MNDFALQKHFRDLISEYNSNVSSFEETYKNSLIERLNEICSNQLVRVNKLNLTSEKKKSLIKTIRERQIRGIVSILI